MRNSKAFKYFMNLLYFYCNISFQARHSKFFWNMKALLNLDNYFVLRLFRQTLQSLTTFDNMKTLGTFGPLWILLILSTLSSFGRLLRSIRPLRPWRYLRPWRPMRPWRLLMKTIKAIKTLKSLKFLTLSVTDTPSPRDAIASKKAHVMSWKHTPLFELLQHMCSNVNILYKIVRKNLFVL